MKHALVGLVGEFLPILQDAPSFSDWLQDLHPGDLAEHPQLPLLSPEDAVCGSWRMSKSQKYLTYTSYTLKIPESKSGILRKHDIPNWLCKRC